MESLEREVQVRLEAGVVKVGYDPRIEKYYASGNFHGLRVTAYLSDDDVDFNLTSHRDGEAMVLEKLYADAREALRAAIRAESEGKLGFGFVR